MTLKQRIEGFTRLGDFIRRHYSDQRLPSEQQIHEGLDKIIAIAETYNNWFIPKFVNEAVQNISIFLEKDTLQKFTATVPEKQPKTVALICAGNIPMVGFHDLLCVLLSGNKVLLKLSSDDNILLPFFLKLLTQYEPEFEKLIFFSDGKLSNFDAIIATGSNNTASHLHYYFGKYPHIIRKNRSSVAVLRGDESSADLKALGKDIFQYFGLGCRNVSKLLVPKNYDFKNFFEAIVDYGFVVNNKKYGNNYDYHRTLYLLEAIPFLDNNFLILRENPGLHSPVSVLFYQKYTERSEIQDYLQTNENELQCVIGRDFIPFGYSQSPVITEFADKVDTLGFLVNL